jgi:acyl-coenzyme A thioesterase PaaI-like protein
MDDETRRASQHLAEEMRRIVSRLAVVRPPAAELEAAAKAAADFADHLDRLPERTTSWEISEAGLQPRDFVAFSPVSGRSSPLAPPVTLRIVDDPESEGGVGVEGEATYGAQYEGPPGHVHGGMIAAMFDEMLGFAQLGPGFTAYLKVDYRKPTPLNRQLTLRAWVDRTERRKRWIRGTSTLDGVLIAEAEGLFIAPEGGVDYLARLGMKA